MVFITFMGDTNDNRFSILFLWVKNSNNEDNNALQTNPYLSKCRQTRRVCSLQTFLLYYRETGTITKSNLKRQNSKLQVSFALSLDYM